MALTLATHLYLSADSVMVAITALPETAQLSPVRVRKDITAHMGARLHNPSGRLEVKISTRSWIVIMYIHLDILMKCMKFRCFLNIWHLLMSFFLSLSRQLKAVFCVTRRRWTVSCWSLLPPGLRLSSALSAWNVL